MRAEENLFKSEGYQFMGAAFEVYNELGRELIEDLSGKIGTETRRQSRQQGEPGMETLRPVGICLPVQTISGNQRSLAV
jgi:hypothetical protein